ncbi:hypothetical protein GW17_00047269 [Ensete ventricosum]|nr:hypothetical protein GW17_00047269 [Ensete ventricosum]
MLTYQHPVTPQQTPQQGVPQSPLTRGEQPDNGGPRHLPTEVTIENLNASVMQPASHSRHVVCVPSEPNIISLDSTDSVREQLRQVNQSLDVVQREFIKLKEEISESSKDRSLFVPEIQDKPIRANFRRAALTHRSILQHFGPRWLSTIPQTL